MISDFRENSSLYCVDYGATDINLYSSWISYSDYSALYIMAVPCGTEFEDLETSIRNDCEWDQQKVFDYLTTIEVVTYYNQGVFRQDRYGDERI